jgi:heat shock protein HslJ
MKRFGISMVMVMLILSLAAGAVAAAPAPQAEEGQDYIVEAGDTLSKIAEATYGDKQAYPAIVAATNAIAETDSSYMRIDDPDVIEIGQKLWLPASVDVSAVQAAPQATSPMHNPFVGRYGALLPAADTSGRNIVLEVAMDGSLLMVTDYLEARYPPIVDVGAWTENEDGTIAAVITGMADGTEYVEPETFTFALDGDTLSAVEWDQTMWGSEGLTMERLAQPEAARFFGVYQASLPSASGMGRALALTLSLDWAAILLSDYNNDEAPIVEVGDWTYNPDGTITVTLSGRMDGTLYDAPETLTFELTDDQLTATAWDEAVWGSEGLTMTKLFEWPEASAEQGEGMAPQELTGVWKWQKTEYGNDDVITPADSERYTVEFAPTGKLAGLADCNRLMGSYTVDGSALTIGPLASTKMLCPGDSQGDVFTRELQQVVAYVIADGMLYLDLPVDTGTMVFAR